MRQTKLRQCRNAVKQLVKVTVVVMNSFGYLQKWHSWWCTDNTDHTYSRHCCQLRYKVVSVCCLYWP